jgi:hypothetical protein
MNFVTALQMKKDPLDSGSWSDLVTLAELPFNL